MYIIFSDLDGTLLDHSSYNFDKAIEGLHILKQRNIPLILCSSKTRLEIEDIRIKIENKDPFIVENGGAIFIPEEYFKKTFDKVKIIDNYLVIEIGFRYPVIRKKLEELKGIVSCSLRGFGDMTEEEISQLTNLSINGSKKASKREYTEPFILDDKMQRIKIMKALKGTKFSITKGGRFFHLLGPNDKGLAVRILTDIYKENYGEETIVSIGIGDSKNDIPMLENVSYSFAVKKSNDEFDRNIVLHNVKLVDGIGPVGWNKIIISLFR